MRVSETDKNTKKIHIELTSKQAVGWTWRKVGAKQPKGELDQALLSADAKLGDQLWVEISTTIDGVTVESVLPETSEGGSKNGSEILERIPPSFDPVILSKVKKSKAKGKKAKQKKSKGKLAPSKVKKAPEGSPLNPKLEHRTKWAASFEGEKKQVAELLNAGGIAAVQAAVEKGADKSLLDLAKKLEAKNKLMKWLDTCEAAIEGAEKARIADLRTVLAESDKYKKDSKAVTMTEALSEKLMSRLDKEHTAWLENIQTLLEEGRSILALKMSARPPKAGSPLPPDLFERLLAEANQILTVDVTNRHWVNSLRAVAQSPIAQRVTPASYPSSPSPELLEIAKRNERYIPEIAEKLLASVASED